MNLLEIMKNRRSIRRFRSDSVPDKYIKGLIEAASSAPSAGNIQPWEFIIIRSNGLKESLAKAAYGQGFIVEAPIVIVVCANEAVSSRLYGDRGRDLYCIQDTAAAIQNLLLYASSEGLGSCWIGAFREAEVKKVLYLPTFVRPIAIIPLGYPAESPERPLRKPISEITHFERY